MAAGKRINGDDALQLIQNGLRRGVRVLLNENTLSRAALMQTMGDLDPIDVDMECRYPKNLGIEDYWNMYERCGVATRVVSIYPDECWKMAPFVYESEDLNQETEFEKAWDEMNKKLNVLAHLQTADEISGIGEFGIIVFGFNDGKSPDQPVGGIRPDGSRDNRFTKQLKLTSIRTFSERNVRISDYEQNITNPRYGLPTYYSVDFSEPVTGKKFKSFGKKDQLSSGVKIHWTRVLHIADNRKDSPVLGIPREKPVYNDLLNIRKILGSNAQGYWQGGFPGISIETQSGIEGDFDKDLTKAEVKKYIESMQRYLLLEGLTAKTLNVQVADPRSHFETHLEAICICLGVPLRVFKGSEEGKLASGQDMRTWHSRVSRRQKYYVEPWILVPFFERMFEVGALPRPKELIISWPDLNAPTENDRANTAQKITDAMVKYITGNVFAVMPPREYLHVVLGYPLPQVESVMRAAEKKFPGVFDKLVKLATAPPLPPSGSVPPVVKGQPTKKGKLRKTKKVGTDEGVPA